MTDKSNQSPRSNRHSELLNGKRPAADARLLRDIFEADDEVSETRQEKASSPAAPERKRHEAHIEAKSNHKSKVAHWE